MEVTYLEGYNPEIFIKVSSINFDHEMEAMILKAKYGDEEIIVCATYMELTENGWVAGISENH